jgi:hypothetical protein
MPNETWPLSANSKLKPGNSVATMGPMELPWQRSRMACGLGLLRIKVVSTAEKYSNRPGSVRIWMHVQGTVTCDDGREWTACLLFAKQGVRGSSPLSSTGQKQNPNSRT